MERLLHDLRFAVRTLRKNPGFAIVAVLTLALGIGANTAVFSVVNGVILRPLPYPQPDRVVYLIWQWRAEGGTSSSATAFKYDYWRRHNGVFEAVSTRRGWTTAIGGGTAPVEVSGSRVAEGFFRVNGIQPVLGRAFRPAEDRPGAPRVAVLSNTLWRSLFHADPDVLGRTVQLGGEAHTVIGVMPPGFRFPEAPGFTDFFVPLRLQPDPRDHGHNYQVRARVRPGVTPAQVDADLRAISEQFREDHPELMGENEFGMRAVRYGDVYTRGVERTLWVLLGAVGFVLLIACANVANLLMVRAAGRQREMAIRAAIGAGRGRIVRQLLTESVLLALIAAVVGLVVGAWSLDALLALAPAGLPRIQEIGLDGRVFGFTLLLGIATGVAFGLTAAVHASRTELSGSLREGGARQTADRRRRRVRSLFAASEAALAVVLLTGAGLLIVSFFQLRGVDAGFDPDGLLAAHFSRTPPGFTTTERVWSFERRLLQRIEALPGVEAAAAASALPLQGQFNFPMTVVGRPEATRGDVQWRAITPGYFAALRIPLLRGRVFSERDGAQAPPVVIISETLARKYFGERDPIGQRIDIGTYQGKERIPGFNDPERTIVGVVADVRALGLDRTPTETMYIPRAQAPDNPDGLGVAAFGGLVIRADAAGPLAPAVLGAIHDIDPRVPIPEFRAMRDVIGASLSEQRFHAALLGIFAGLALVLTAIGIYGVVSYTVRQRTGEIGVRMALGAQRGAVLRLIVRQGMTPVSVGLGVGLVAAFGLTRLITALLFGVSPTDPITFAAVAAVLAIVALAATYLPARSAAAADPVVALRAE